MAPINTAASSLKPDEQVIFFNTSAYLDGDGQTWNIPLHGWIFEPEDDSIWRTAVVEELIRFLELDEQAVGRSLFRQRAKMFLVDNERWKRLPVRVGDHVVTAKRSGANGHFTGLFRLDRKYVERLARNSWLTVEAVVPAGDDRRFEGAAKLIGRSGVSVISDIDDTIKVSNVLDKKELLANTFLREFQAVAGMAEVYRRWAEAGAVFHYLSSSPWQLYPSLANFITAQGFPRGSFHLQFFRMKDRTFFNLFTSPEESKYPRIEHIFQTYSDRQFILVGDSGEKDPEVYGAVARHYPHQIKHIFIRNLSQASEQHARFSSAFETLPEDRWTVFRNPCDLVKINLHTQ
ncbi:MAG: DUF2183 domain-containing protein [Desulfobacterales bacterium]|nr:MAG: DUF2183 domain-containing protein [Desulfobacterales bacterium]